MKDLGRELVSEGPFSEVVIGNTALVRAMVEGGVEVATSYPGSPTPEIADAIRAIPASERPFYFEFSTNEKVALEVAFGAAINGRPSTVFFKSVGLNVAADSFVQLSLMDIPGGMVVILGDDPGANSSQNEQDNRHYARLACLPMIEPATAAEAYSMFLEALRLARAKRTAVILRMTTHVCHAKEKVAFGRRPAPCLDRSPRFDPEAWNYIPLGAAVHPLKRRALARLEEFRAEFEGPSFARRIAGGDASRGVLAAGTARLSLLDALDPLPHEDRPEVLELLAVHPLPRKAILEFLAGKSEVKILEELDPIIEEAVKAFAYDRTLSVRIIGKTDAEEMIGEYLPDKTRAILAATWPALFPPPLAPRAEGRPAPPRPPQLCPGCGHRSAFYAIKKALAAADITVADIGCHTLGYLPPYEMGRVLLSMGHSTSTAAGLSLFNSTRRVLCFIGDSTFFHAGLPGIVNAVFNSHNVTLVVMENGTTAMTGHQDHPGAGRNFNGEAPKIGIRAALEGLGVTDISEVDAYKQAELARLVREALARPGFKVVIARHPCMLKHDREARRRPGFVERHVRVGERCSRFRECIERFGCPSFQIEARGPAGQWKAIAVSRDLCIGDGSCRQTCPTEAIVPDDAGGPGSGAGSGAEGAVPPKGGRA